MYILFVVWPHEMHEMNLTVEATYEDGVLKPTRPLPLKEHQRVQITLQPAPQQPLPTPDEAERAVRKSQGLLGWSGDAETLRRVAEVPPQPH